MDIQNRHILVVGLARSGLAVAHALARRGAVVTVSDSKQPAEFRDALPALLKEKVGLELGLQREETFLKNDLIVISPGVPWDMPQLKAARDRGIPVYPEVEAATWFLEGTLVGITGSNGKTTTTTLLGDMLRASGFPTFVGGNIGSALSTAVDQAQPGTRFVTELSSFQLEGIHDFDPHVAVMLNLSPNHLDRHPSLEAYAQAKRQIFKNQGAQDYAVLNADDPWVAGLQDSVASRPILFSRRRELPNGVFAAGGKVYYRVRHLERVLFETSDVNLRGDFNLEDVLAATAAACVLGADFNAIRRAVRAFQAVEHRLEHVRAIQGVEFFNNSKATSVDATLKSLEAFSHGVHLIMGGKDKGAPYTPLIPLIKDRVREILVIGAAAPIITQQLGGSTEVVQADDLATAVYWGFANAEPGDTVLLAPACSSFDQFKDYEERGRIFKELVHRLANDAASGAVERVQRKGAGSREQGLGVKNQELGVRSQKSEIRSQEPGVRSEKSEVSTDALAAKPQGAPLPPEKQTTRGRESGIGNLASEVAQPQIPRPDSSPEVRTSSLEPLETAPTKQMAKPEGEPDSQLPTPPPRVPSPPHHIELTYVYEVDAVEAAEPDSQLTGEEEPALAVTDGTAEVLDDDVLPFELRPKTKSEVRGPKSQEANPKAEGKSNAPGSAGSSQQPKLFDGSDT